ncbi:hypothetical protein Tco_0737199 [Tanacetum coccineum]
MFLEKLARDTFSGTKGEDVVEHIEKFLKIIRPINIQNVSNSRLWINVFPISLTGRNECLRKKQWFRVSHLVDYRFENWVAANFERYMTMDHYTMNSLWKFWNKNYGNEEVKSDSEPCVDKEGGSDKENEIAEIFRIETNLFNYETPLCIAFKEFNHLLQIDPNVLTDDVFREKYYEQYKDDWIYEWNDKIPWVSEKPWKLYEIWKEPVPVKHCCEPFNYETDVQNGQLVAGEMMDTVMEETYLDNIKLATKSIIKIMSEESNGDAWSSYSPIDEWSDQEEVNNKEPDVNYDPYLDIARLFNSHTKKEEGKDDQGKNKSIGEQDNHLVRGHERCGKSKGIRSHQETWRIRMDDNQGKCVSRIPRHLPQDGRGMVRDKGGMKKLQKSLT